jgi:hypothetical protein
MTKRHEALMIGHGAVIGEIKLWPIPARSRFTSPPTSAPGARRTPETS